jgi:hypothetical protein
MTMRTTIAFVCQCGPIELQSVLLAASLRQHVRGDHELVACLPGPHTDWGEPAAATLRCLDALGVRTAATANPIGADYPIGNKVGAAAIATTADRVLLLDSDILCLRELDLDRCFGGGFLAKPADVATFPTTPATWTRLYERFRLPAPDRRVTATVSGDEMWPYFNAGVVAFPVGAGFPQAWADCCRVIDREPDVPARRPHLDQIALPIAAARCGLDFTPLPERLNFPAHLMPLADAAPILCHYHWPQVLRREPALVRAVAELIERHAELAAVFDRSDCRDLLLPALRRTGSRPRGAVAGPAGAAGPRPDPPPVDGIVTGIPRSGTSYLCGCLHRLHDQVAINEPVEVFAALRKRRPWGVPILHADLRARILAGEPVENKLRGERVVEDTAVHDVRGSYRPAVSRADFGLWTKNTLAYLARLAQLADVMPWAPVVACVRHPCDAIGSWIATFPHLREAAVEQFPIGGPGDPWIGAAARERLEAVAACGDPPLRRALLWRHLATTILERRGSLTIVRYEDLVADPAAVLRDLVGRLPGGPVATGLDALSASVPRRNRERLAGPDHDAIQATCADVARELGYEL